MIDSWVSNKQKGEYFLVALFKFLIILLKIWKAFQWHNTKARFLFKKNNLNSDLGPKFYSLEALGEVFESEIY